MPSRAGGLLLGRGATACRCGEGSAAAGQRKIGEEGRSGRPGRASAPGGTCLPSLACCPAWRPLPEVPMPAGRRASGAATSCGRGAAPMSATSRRTRMFFPAGPPCAPEGWILTCSSKNSSYLQQAVIDGRPAAFLPDSRDLRHRVPYRGKVYAIIWHGRIFLCLPPAFRRTLPERALQSRALS